ncbi:MAG: hypothetical protein ABSB29_00740 [Nitrososphaerales archaeon]
MGSRRSDAVGRELSGEVPADIGLRLYARVLFVVNTLAIIPSFLRGRRVTPQVDADNSNAGAPSKVA